MNKINLAEKFGLFSEHWTPKIVGVVNNQFIKLAKVQGEFVWHKHDQEDELFWVVQGHLVIEFRDGRVDLTPGELFVVPKGVEHRPWAEVETYIVLIEPQSTAHTGDIIDNLTVPIDQQHYI